MIIRKPTNPTGTHTAETDQFRFFAAIGLAILLLNSLSSYIQERKLVWQYVLNDLWVVPYLVLLNYLFFAILVPRMSIRKPFRTLAYLGVTFVLAAFGAYLWRRLGGVLHLFTVVGTYEDVCDEICAYLGRSLASVLFFGLVRHVYGHYKLRQTAQQLRIEKQAAELNFLKSQTNPHFLFNTLNNIYSLARDKSEQAPESILRLSELLRFMLYETSGNTIAVGQEVKIITDYIALEKLRYDDRLQVNFHYTIRDMEQPIPPLLLIPLVENAFKHGASEHKNTQPVVHIRLEVTPQTLVLEVKNTTDKTDKGLPVQEGIGLSNLRRQLELQYTAYQLDTRLEGTYFIATLNINLDSHV